MDVVSTGPLRVASAVWQPSPGAWALVVVCKATFRLTPGKSPLAEVQDAPALDDTCWDGDPTRSLAAPGDLVPFKARADVLVVGHAFAPGGQPVRTLVARLQVGSIDKRIEVWCDRIFWHDGRLLEGPPFASMPLRYERAAGGPGTANPVGVSPDALPDAQGTVPVPNLQPPGVRVAWRGDTFATASFAPVAPWWPGRVEKLGRHAAGGSQKAVRERPLPADLDRAYFNAAPPDQQLAVLAPDARLVLENLHPTHAHLETRLESVTPVAQMTAGGRAGEEVTLTPDTLCIDTDRGLATVVWRGRVPLRHAGEEGRVTVSLVGAAPMPTEAATVPFGLEGPWRGRALPFPAQEEPPRAMETMLGGRDGGPALPFGPANSPWKGFQVPPPVIQEPARLETGTLVVVHGKARGVLPFPGALQPRPVARIEHVEPAEPAEIDDEETPPVSAAEPPAAAVSAEAPEPVAQAAPVEVPIERCAAITASIARRKAETARILEAEALDPAAWSAVTQRWSEAIREEAARGKTELLRAYDRAYVARIEEERGPIEVAEYARLVVAAERGTLAEALAALGLPRAAMMRIERVWLERTAEDPGLGESMRRQVRAAREA